MKTNRVYKIMDGFRIQTDSFEVTIQATQQVPIAIKNKLLDDIVDKIESSLSEGNAIQKIIDYPLFSECHCKMTFIPLNN